LDGDGYTTCDGDCADNNPNLNLDDADGDGTSSCDGDCDDGNSILNIDDVDGDGASTCDGDCDDNDGTLNLDDADRDGASTCDDDCDDNDGTRYPGATEHCDGIDSDCDGAESAVVTLDGTTSFATIQGAVDRSRDGSTIVVCDGTFTENLVISKSITLESLNGSAATVIDGGAAGTTVIVTSSASLSGFTISGGSGSPNPFDPSETIGGGVWAKADLSLKDCEISGNTADFGGGLVGQGGIDLDLDGVIIDSNTGTLSGGGMYLDDVTATFVDSEVSNNVAVYGGGVYIQDATLELTNTSINTNQADFGGAVFAAAAVLDLGTGDLTGNVADDGGGGGYLIEDTTVEAGTVSDNIASYGGGFYVGGSDEFTITDTVISDNQADTSASSAGGVYVRDTSLLMTGVTLSGNYSAGEGGGISIDGGDAILDSCTITGNEGALYSGGGHVFTGSLESISSDWGAGASNNTPDDMGVEGGQSYSDFGLNESFTCSSSTGRCF
jgi:hypothetical protein